MADPCLLIRFSGHGNQTCCTIKTLCVAVEQNTACMAMNIHGVVRIQMEHVENCLITFTFGDHPILSRYGALLRMLLSIDSPGQRGMGWILHTQLLTNGCRRQMEKNTKEDVSSEPPLQKVVSVFFATVLGCKDFAWLEAAAFSIAGMADAVDFVLSC